MSERRLVKRDHVRELMYVNHLDNPACKLIAVTDDQLEILRVCVRYASRRINWDDQDVGTHSYYLPDDTTWDSILALVHDLELRLMETCDVGLLITALENLMCICDHLDDLGVQLSQDVGIVGATPLLLDQKPSAEDEALIDTTGLPATDLELCELANSIWGWGTEVITEQLIPLADLAVDKLTILITLTDVFAILTGGIGLTMAVAIEVFTAIIRWWADYAETNLVNWIDGSGQEAVCELYTGFRASGWEEARANLAAMIDDEPQLSFGDKMVLKWVLTKDYVMKAVQYAIDGSLLDPDDYFSFACGSCETPPSCWDFNDVGWTIEACGTLDPITGYVVNGCASNALLASHSVTVAGNFELGVYCERLYDASYNYDIRVYLAGNPVFSWKPLTDAGESYQSTTTTDVVAGTYEIRIYGITGTATVYHYVCALE